MAHMQADGDIVDDRQVAEQADVLKGSRHAEARILLGSISRDVLAAEDDPPAARLEHAGQQIEGRGLAGTVRSDEADELARRDRRGRASRAPCTPPKFLRSSTTSSSRLAARFHAPPAIRAPRFMGAP